MNKAQLVEKLSRKTLLTKVQSEVVLDAALEIITRAVSKGDDVKIVGFGTFMRGGPQSEKRPQPEDRYERRNSGNSRPEIQARKRLPGFR